MKRILSLILIIGCFLSTKNTFAQNVQFVGTKDNTVVTRNIARDDSAHEFALTDTSKHPSRPGRMISFNGSPYWWNGIFWYRLNGDTSTVPGQVNADWTSTTGVSLILHKPTFATVATSGIYGDLTGKPTIPAAQVSSDWNALSGVTLILNKPRIVDSVFRIPGKDSIFFIINRGGTLFTYGIKDSTGTTGSSGVTSISSGNLNPLFTASFNNPTGAVALGFTLNNAPANTFFGNNTAGVGIPGYSSIQVSNLPGNIPISKTTIKPAYGIKISGDSIYNDTSVNYPRFLSILRPGGTDSIYYLVKTNATTTVQTFGYIDSIRLTAKGAANGYPLSYQTGPSTFYTRKVLPGTNIGISVNTDSTLVINNSLTSVANNLQVINGGGARSITVGTIGARPAGTTGDFYYATDNGTYYYYNGTSWVPVVSGAGSKDTIHLAQIGAGINPIFTSNLGDSIYQKGFKNSATIGVVRNSDSSISWNSLLAGINSINITGANAQLVNDISSGTLKLYGFDATSTRNFITFSSLPVTVGSINGLFPYQYKNRIDSNLTILNDRTYPLLDSIFTASPTLDSLIGKRIELVQGTGVNIVNNSDIHKNSWTISSSNTGGSPNSNVGSAYRFAIPNTNNIKTASAGTGIGIDSTTANQLNFSIDPLVVATLTNVQSLTNKTLISPKLNTTSTATYVWTATDNLGNGAWSPATTGYVNPMTTLGDIVFENATPVAARLAGNTTTTPQVLWQTGNGTISSAPTWHTLVKGDIGLGNVENTALSTWAGSANLTTVGTIGTGVWNATVVGPTKGGTGLTTYTPYAVITGGTTSTGNLQQVSGVGSSLQALVSNGASTLPTWQGVVNSLTGTTNEVSVTTANGNITISTPQPTAVTSTPTFGGGTFNGVVKIADGTQASGRVFTSDASGNGTWQASAGSIAANNGLTLTSGNIGLGGTLGSATVVLGAGNPISFGTNVSGLNTFNVYANNDVILQGGGATQIDLGANNISINGAIQYSNHLQTDGNMFTGNGSYINFLGVITANRTITMSATAAGQMLYFMDRNTSGFTWSFATTVKDNTGSTITNLTNGSTYQLIYDGTNWIKIN